MDAAVAGGDDAAARLGGTAGPGGHDAPGAGDDRDQRRNVMGLELGLDDEIDMAGGEHAIGVAVAAIARQKHLVLDHGKGRAVLRIHQPRARGVEHRLREAGAWPRQQGAVARRPAIMRRRAVAGEPLGDEGLVDHAEHRPSAPGQRDQRAPGRHARNEGLGAVDGIEHPDELGVRPFRAELLADDAVGRELLPDHGAHGGSAARSAAVTGSKAPPRLLSSTPSEVRKNGTNRVSRDRRQLIDERHEIDCRHAAFASPRLCPADAAPSGSDFQWPGAASGHVSPLPQIVWIRGDILSGVRIPLFFVQRGGIFLQCGSAISRVTAALLGRFLPRLGPLAR